jgi:DegV family protein with EDD domain
MYSPYKSKPEVKMSKTGVVTDSTCCLPVGLLEKYGIRVAPVAFVSEGKVYRDYLDLTMEQFWKMLKEFKTPPTTSAVGIGEFYDAYTSLIKQTRQIVCMTVSRKLSATCSAAEEAAKMIIEENPGIVIKVIDSNTSQAALGFLALEAARAAEKGKSLEEVAAVVEGLNPRVKYLMILDTISPLQRIGRAPDIKNPEGSLPVKPILGMVNNVGVVENLGKAATIDEAVDRVADMIKDYTDTSKPVHFVLNYPDRTTEIERLRGMLESKYKVAELYLAQYTPTILLATGPMFGVSFYS